MELDILSIKELEANNEDIFAWLSDEHSVILKDHDRIFEQAEKENLEDSNIINVYEVYIPMISEADYQRC